MTPRPRRRPARRASRAWPVKEIAGLALAVATAFGYGDVRLREARRTEDAEARVRGVSENAGRIIGALALAVDSLDVRVTALERENARLRRRRGPVTDTVYLFNAEEYGPQPRPPGFLSRLLGRG